MSKVLVVFGATGNQGGSIVDYVLNDPTLSKEFKVRAITRNPSSATSQSLKGSGAEVVQGDIDDPSTHKSALEGAHTIFLATYSDYTGQLAEQETRQGRSIADAAVAAGAKYFIYSTLLDTSVFHKGKLQLPHFDVKAEIETYIRSLPIKSAFFAPGSFMQNFSATQAPRPLGDGTYALFNFVSPETLAPLIETKADTGKYVGAILAEPEKYEGKVLWAATELVSWGEMVEVMSKKSGKTVVYKQLPKEVFAGFMPEGARTMLADMFEWMQGYGYYGPETKERVEWTVQQARGKLTTLEEYLEKNPLVLE